MKSNKGRGTSPELKVRAILREIGFPGYRLNWAKAPGKPDIAYPGRKIAIFVNGCFWHRCPHCHPSMPAAHRDYWEEKFARNVERDRRELAELESEGWTVEVIWECELKDPEKVRSRLIRLLDVD
jgi:DNA mismatch endonuclease Vsr